MLGASGNDSSRVKHLTIFPIIGEPSVTTTASNRSLRRRASPAVMQLYIRYRRDSYSHSGIVVNKQLKIWWPSFLFMVSTLPPGRAYSTLPSTSFPEILFSLFSFASFSFFSWYLHRPGSTILDCPFVHRTDWKNSPTYRFIPSFSRRLYCTGQSETFLLWDHPQEKKLFMGVHKPFGT